MKKIIFVIAFCLLKGEGEPKITLEQQVDYLQARAEFAEAQLSYINAKDKYEEIVKKLQAICTLELTNGRPVCKKPTEEKPKAK